MATATDGAYTWIHSDYLHSATILTDEAGAEVRRLAYRAFGKELENTGTGTDPTYSCTGKERDASGLLYYGVRYYDPDLSRFITADTMYDWGTQGLNRYSYALNNNDPGGHTVESSLDLISRYREDISSIATEHELDPLLLAGVVFAENCNDYNWLRGKNWSSFPNNWFNLPGGPVIKNMLAPLIKDNPSLGITEVTVAVAAMMDNPEFIPAYYAEMSREEREKLHGQIAKNVSSDERKQILAQIT